MKKEMTELARKRWRQARELTKDEYERRTKEGQYIPIIPDAEADDFHKKYPKQSFVTKGELS